MKIYYNQVKPSLLEIKEDRRSECFNFGKDNAFPSLVEALIGMSVTAKTCVDRVCKVICGAAFGPIGEVIVNAQGQTLNEVLRIAAREYASFNNVYLHIGYNLNGDIKSIKVVPATSVRIGKADSKGYSGKFIIYDNWDKSKKSRVTNSDFELVDKYSNNVGVLVAQIEKAGGIEKYKGQILHIRKDTSFVYSLPEINPVLSEALLEANSQTFRSKGAAKGFLNQKVIAVQPFADDTERREFKKDLDSLRGADNSSDVLILESSQISDDLSKTFNLQDLSGAYNDKLFEYSDNQAERSICKAFSVPLVLVNPSDNSMFGNSGEVLKEARQQLWDSRKEDRMQIESVFTSLMNKFKDKITKPLTVINPFIDEEEEAAAKNINKQAQATLRGSVGGVTGIISLASSVKAGVVDKESAVAIIQNVYGFSETKAKAMIGGFEDEVTEVQTV